MVKNEKKKSFDHNNALFCHFLFDLFERTSEFVQFHLHVRLKQNKYIGIHNQGMDILRICHLEGNTLIYGDTFCFPFTSRWVVLRKLIWFSRFSDASPETEETV